ncbi:MAG: 3-methyl-2-oxobutanoate hydroxymethyltransferase [Candidatus Saganbacteria bacterium]|uniref:3-methyl-2-oxobutanoate hydroxymethyltransferase n=1 Tax=Candidatus Saganbacteria bacterium TaxID=2575572 RepID=A0A833L0X7_UNCSA|nr:MAG: 3-methyl-2-oxobutanoate hydroxymethyltransferase [Candidatus Saganbacteria bacterium]
MDKKEKVTPLKIIYSKKTGKKISALTAYDFTFAQILDESGIDIILVGDSLGNVMLGYKNTIPVTNEEMVMHVKAVSRAVNRALIVADMPFGSFQNSSEAAVSNAVKLIKAGAEAVKLEGAEYIKTIKEIIKAGIPVMGHLGFVPQSVNALGYKVQGKEKQDANKIVNDAQALEKAGCFAIVLEMIPHDLAKIISKKIKIPTIGIGAGANCDGQIFVTYDMLGLYGNPPKFVKKYEDFNAKAKAAVKKYIEDINS